MQNYALKLACGLFAGAAILIGGVCVDAGGEDKKKKPGKKKAIGKRVAGNLDNPCGIAVQPGTDHVFIAARDAVYRFNPDGEKKKRRRKVIKGYPTDVYGKGPKYNIGPLGLAFLDKGHLVVGDGSRKDGDELVRIYHVGDTFKGKVLNEADAEHTLGPIKAGDKSAKGEGNFYGVAFGAGAIFVTCNGDDTKGWVSKIPVNAGEPGKLTPSIATKVATEVDAPVPVTFTPDGKQLVVGQMGEIKVPRDSLLTFYDPKSGKLMKNMKTGLYDVTGLAYSPKTGKLYATDFAWMDTKKKGGLYRLDIEGDSVTAVRIRRLDKPTALAFDSKGRLFITIFGTAKEGSKKKPGGVIMIPAGL